MVTVGPLLQDPTNKDEDTVIMEWLSKQEASSVVFVSFGSEYFLSKEEIEEIARAQQGEFHMGCKVSWRREN